MSVAPRGGGRGLCWIPTLLWVLPLYWLAVFPRARRELRHWHERAEEIPDPTLRRQALGKLHAGRDVVEGAAAFAILARARHRRDVIRACVAFEVIYEYVDVVGEQPVDDVLAHNRQIHRALVAAVDPAAAPEDHYLHYPGHDDGGYLQELIDACRTSLAKLPTEAVTSPAMRRLAALAGETQSLNHAGTWESHRGLVDWVAARPVQDATWWELAAAASSPLGVYALLAAASDRRTAHATATVIEDAYFPWVGAVVWLLESLVDYREDAITGNHCYFANYASHQDATRRLVAIALRAGRATDRLPCASRHGILLAGGVGLYLSMPQARDPDLRPVVRAVRRAIGGPITPLIVVLHARRLVGRLLNASLRGASAAGA